MSDQKPTEIVPSHFDDQGYWVPPKSTCCGRSFVYLDFETDTYVPWSSEGNPIPFGDLYCGGCNRKPAGISGAAAND